jgi:origin recognition complex subunit 4
MREIARQLTQQTGSSFLVEAEEGLVSEEEDNPFLEKEISISLPPPSHLPSLISVLPTLSRPTIVVLDGFDLFALHARQSLLYCLLDTVQSCRVGHGHKGIAIIGVTSRIDTINLLEKRVKSRFSGRMIRTAPPRQLKCWIELSRHILCATIEEEDEEWQDSWTTGVEKFLSDSAVVDRLTETFEITRDVRMLLKLLVSVITS